MTKLAETNNYNFRVAKSNAEVEEKQYTETAEARQQQLSADVAAFLANGGKIQEVQSDDQN